MKKFEFLQYLRRKLKKYPTNEVNDAVGYYDELISDKMRDGMSERDAVASLGDKREIVKNCVSTMSSRRGGNESYETSDSASKAGGKVGAVFLGVLASPVLLPLGIVFAVLVFVIFVVWISLVAAFGAVCIGGVAAAFGNWFSFINIGSALIQTGGGLILAVVGFCLCGVLAYYGYRFVLKTVRALKNAFFKRK